MEHRHHSFFQNKITEGITLIIACDGNFNIGINGTMLFRIPGDLKNYKNLTMGKNLYCGRKTFGDMGALPGRHITVLTSRTELEGADRIINDFEEFKRELMNDKNGYLVGGASLVKKLYPEIDRILMTKVQETFEADTGIGDPEEHGFMLKAQSETYYEVGLHYQYIEYARE